MSCSRLLARMLAGAAGPGWIKYCRTGMEKEVLRGMEADLLPGLTRENTSMVDDVLGQYGIHRTIALETTQSSAAVGVLYAVDCLRPTGDRRPVESPLAIHHQLCYFGDRDVADCSVVFAWLGDRISSIPKCISRHEL